MLQLIIDGIFYDVGMLMVPELFDKWYPAVQKGGETLASTAASIRSSPATAPPP